MKIAPERFAAFQLGVGYGAREAVKEVFAQLRKESGISVSSRDLHRLTELALGRVSKKLRKSGT